MANPLKKLAREPLLHFFLLGVAIFVAYSLVSNHASGEPGKIVVTQGQLASMLDSFAQTRQRPPTQEEWEGLIRDRVRQEVFYREALALGLDKDDLIIRRRLQQKMEFVSDDVAAQAKPTDDELRAYLQAHSDSFRVDPRFTFRQVFLNPEKHGKNLASDAMQLVEQLNQADGKTDLSKRGDSILLDYHYEAVTVAEISRLFGDRFAKSLDGLPLGQWQGPVESAYGAHLVFVSERVEGRLPALADVRDAALREWEETHRREANDKFYVKLLKHYTVTIEKPAPEVGNKVATIK